MRNFTIAFIVLLIASLGGYFVFQKNKPIKISPKKSKVVDVSPKDEFYFSNQNKDLKGIVFGDTKYILESNILSKRESLEDFDKTKENNLGVFGELESPDDPNRYSIGVTYKLKLNP